MVTDINNYYEVALVLVKEAGKTIINKFNKNKNVATKEGRVDFLTEVDKEIEDYLINGLKRNFPKHKFIGEESFEGKTSLTADPTWIIDPIDGTMNFVHKNPAVSISVGLCIEKVPTIGIVYIPLYDKLFTAIKGQGAFLNSEKIHVSDVKDFSDALLYYEGGNYRELEKVKIMEENYSIILRTAHGYRANGTCAFNMSCVAMGAGDAFFDFGIHAWDIAAGSVIVNEAGGVVIDPAGGPFDIMSCRMLCASSAELAKQISQSIKQYYPKRDDE